MMRSIAAVVVLLSAFTICADGQAPVATPDPQYLFIDSYSGQFKRETA